MHIRRNHCFCCFIPLQYLLPAIVHINHQPYLERGDGPIVSEPIIAIPNMIKYLIFFVWHTHNLPHSSVFFLHSAWCSLPPESWPSRFSRSLMIMESLPVSKALVSMVELLKDHRFETLKGVGTVEDFWLNFWQLGGEVLWHWRYIEHKTLRSWCFSVIREQTNWIETWKHNGGKGLFFFTAASLLEHSCHPSFSLWSGFLLLVIEMKCQVLQPGTRAVEFGA